MLFSRHNLHQKIKPREEKGGIEESAKKSEAGCSRYSSGSVNSPYGLCLDYKQHAELVNSSVGQPYRIDTDRKPPNPVYYEEPNSIGVEVKNHAGVAYPGCTLYVNVACDGGIGHLSWVTVHYKGALGDTDLASTLDGTGTVSAATDHFTATIGWDDTATITITIHSIATASVTYYVDIYVLGG